MKPLTQLLFVNNTLQRRRGIRENPFRQVSSALSPFIEVKPVQAGPVLPMIQPVPGCASRARRLLRLLGRCWQAFLSVLFVIVLVGCAMGFQQVTFERERLFTGNQRGAAENMAVQYQRENHQLAVRNAETQARLHSREKQLWMALSGQMSDTLLALSPANMPPAPMPPPLLPASAVRLPVPVRQAGPAMMQARHNPGPAPVRKPGNRI